MADDVNIDDVLTYYMGKNTPDRQDFIIENLRASLDQLPADTMMAIEPAEVSEEVELG
jgi:topoisomerase-4 subunit B